jgi:hypothetical protein
VTIISEEGYGGLIYECEIHDDLMISVTELGERRGQESDGPEVMA